MCLFLFPHQLPASGRVPTAKYTKMGETLRHVIPGHMQCSMACGGKACKYENPSRWSDEEQAVKGLYSSWYVGRPPVRVTGVDVNSDTKSRYVCSDYSTVACFFFFQVETLNA